LVAGRPTVCCWWSKNRRSADRRWLIVAGAYPAGKYALPVTALTLPGAGEPGLRSRRAFGAERSHST
jgi:hypothetical protein